MQTLMVIALAAGLQPAWEAPLASLTLKDGTSLEATILKQDAQTLVLEKTDGGTVVVPKDSIQNVAPFWGETLARSSLHLTLDTAQPQVVEEVIADRAAPYGVHPVFSRGLTRLDVAVEEVDAELIPVFARLFTQPGKISFLQPTKKGTIHWHKQGWGPVGFDAGDLNDCHLEERGGIPDGEREKGWRNYMVESTCLTLTFQGASRFVRLPRPLAIAFDGRPFTTSDFLGNEGLSVRLKMERPLEFFSCFKSGPMPEVKVVHQEMNFR